MTDKESDFAKLSIETTGARTSKIILNGTDISKQCRKIVFTHEAGKIPTVSVELLVNDCNCLLEHQSHPVKLV
ncbi:hypothetical protein [Candidatus Agathobaculum pullicola]|uniref:hypothetical protein n=1 Tax=Candidatus Agathobaculum pullicola TaxID=2838426 RepID=UPI003F90EB28